MQKCHYIIIQFSINAGKNKSKKVSWGALPFPMNQVRLLSGSCQEAQEANRRYPHTLPLERLSALLSRHCRNSVIGPATRRMGKAGQRTSRPLRWWPLSAAALLYAAIGDKELKNKADALGGCACRMPETDEERLSQRISPRVF